MLFKLVLRSLAQGRVRLVCAVAGFAVAAGVEIFMSSLVATNRAQAPALARLACAPWAAWQVDGLRLGRGLGKPSNRPPLPAAKNSVKPDLRLSALALTLDYRPGGHVLQGPPARALLAHAPQALPYKALALVEGRWVNGAAQEREVVCARSVLHRFGKQAPLVGEWIKFVGRKGTMSARLVGIMDGAKLPHEFPTAFANDAAFAGLAQEEIGKIAFYRTLPASPAAYLTPTSEKTIAAFRGDEQRRLDYATPLLLLVSLVTALALLVNSLRLSIVSHQRTMALLRLVGLSRWGVVRLMLLEALLCASVGWLVGAVVAGVALRLWVAADPVAFPVGMVFDFGALGLVLVVFLGLVGLALLLVLRPALKVRALAVVAQPVRRPYRGMAIAFGGGFSAFVAVLVWGASLMRAFVPSPEWPDAIVSLLPSGVSAFEIERLRTVEGVRRISELLPLQLDLDGFEGNALFLASEWLPAFNFEEGSHEAVASNSVVVTRMMARALHLHKGDFLRVRVPSAERGSFDVVSLPVAGIVDLNWHMVTSRGLVRGLNGASPQTVGPVFVSFDLLESIDPRPAPLVRMTHLWVDYEPEFLARYGVFEAGRRVEAEIARRLGHEVEMTVRVHARDEIADGTLAHGTDVIGQVARVPFVFLAILALGFVAMLVAEAETRRREFFLLRTIGATRFQLIGRLARTALRTAFWGVFWGLPIGTVMGWFAACHTGNWPGLEPIFAFPWAIILWGALGAIGLAFLVALPTATLVVMKRRAIG